MSSSTSYSDSDPDAAAAAPGADLRRARRSITLFVLLCLTMILVCGEFMEFTAERLHPSLPKIKQAMALQDQPHEVLFLGDSTTNQSANPAAAARGQAWSGYNLATAGANYSTMLLMLRHYLANNAPPELIVLGAYLNKPAASTANLSPHIHVRLSTAEKALADELFSRFGTAPDLQYTLLNAIKVYRYRDMLSHWMKFAVQGRKRVPELVQGHLALRVRLNRPARHPEPYAGGFDAQELLTLLRYCREQGLQVVIFEPPNSPGVSARVSNRQAIAASLQTLVADGWALGFHSFVDTPVELEEWVNWNHLNKFGAERFSAQYLQPLIERYRRAAAAQ